MEPTKIHESTSCIISREDAYPKANQFNILEELNLESCKIDKTADLIQETFISDNTPLNQVSSKIKENSSVQEEQMLNNIFKEYEIFRYLRVRLTSSSFII